MTAWRACNTSVTCNATGRFYSVIARLRTVREDGTREASETVNTGRNCDNRLILSLFTSLYYIHTYTCMSIFVKQQTTLPALLLPSARSCDYIHNKLQITTGAFDFFHFKKYTLHAALRQI